MFPKINLIKHQNSYVNQICSCSLLKVFITFLRELSVKIRKFTSSPNSRNIMAINKHMLSTQIDLSIIKNQMDGTVVFLLNR